MISFPHLSVFYYGTDAENPGVTLHVSSSPEMSGGGTQPKGPPHAPAKKPGKGPKPKKR